MRVLHVISDRDIGGAGRYLLNLLRSGAYRDICVAAACPSPGPLAEALEAARVRVHPLRHADRSFSPALTTDIMAVMSRGKYDVVHTHASLSARIAARLRGGRAVVLTKHRAADPGGASTWPTRWAHAMAAAALTDRIIAISRSVKAWLIARGVPERMVALVYNGIDPAAYDVPEPPQALRLKLGLGRGPLVGTVGRLSPEKGHATFLRAARLILKGDPRARFAVVGEGPLKPRLLELADQLGITESVTFMGFRGDIPAVMAAMDVLVQPSIYEGLGLAVLEGMASRKPVVATRVGGIPEVVRHGHTGFLVKPEEPEEMAEAALKLLRDRELARKMGEEGRRTVESCFHHESMGWRTLLVYRSALERRPLAECGLAGDLP